MHHGKSLAIVFALTTAALSAAPAEAMSIHPTAEGALLPDLHQFLPAATTPTDSMLPQSARQGGLHDEHRDHDALRDGGGSDDRWHDGNDEHGGWGRDGREGHGDDGYGQGDGDHDGRWDGDGHHHHRGDGDGEGTPQTVPLPNALPLLLSGLASLLTVARRRKE